MPSRYGSAVENRTVTVDPARLLLRRALVDGYQRLRRRLTHRLGSPELASEALNETWLALGRGSDLEPVADPDAYVFRVALNAAGALRKREARHAGHADVIDMVELADDAPGPERILAAREEAERMRQALDELSPRQREAFLECYRGETMPEVLAERWQVSVRTIQSDIRAAILHCAERLGRKNILAGKRVKRSSK